ncbi:hypothetical protein Tco_1424808 [Tanacetum coccineum]
MFYRKNVDFVDLIWEDFMFQIDNRKSSAKIKENMPYPRFTKAIIQHFISKDKSISMRNGMFMHSVKNDSVLGTLKFVAKGDDNQVYGKTIPGVMINQEIKNSIAYQTYLAFSTGAVKPKKARKWKQPASTPKKKTRITASDDSDSESAKSLQEEESQLVLSSKILLVYVPDEPKANSLDQESENESWGESEDDDDDCISDDGRIEYDDDKSINLTKTNDEEETQESDDEFVHTSDDYVPTDDETQDNVKLADEDKADEEIIDAEKIEAKHEEIYQEVASAQVQDEGQVTINVVPATHTEKVDAPPSSSSRSVSSNYDNIFLNLDNISSVET